VSIPDIRPNSQDTSAFYLAHIYQQSSTQPNGSQPSIPSTLSDPTLPFSPPTSSVWVNGLWFLSLVVSLSCALLATLLLQWARRYERVAYPPYRPQKRARIRAFYKRGVERWRIPRAVEVLPALLHIALFLFFAGLSVFLFGVNRTIFKTVTAWIGFIVIAYACLTLFPVIHKNSLYFTPLSVLFSFCFTGIRYLFFLIFYRLRIFPRIDNFRRKLHSSRRPGDVHLDDFFSRSMIKTAEEYAFKLKPDIDHGSLLWTFKALDEDAHVEEFFEGLPRLCDSGTGKELELKNKFIKANEKELSTALTGLMDRTLMSNLVKQLVKQRRMIIFTKAIESKSTSSLFDTSQILRQVLFDDWHGLLECVEFGLFMQKWANTSNNDRVTSFYAQCVATLTISIIEKRDKRWIQLATVDSQPLSGSLHHNEDHYSISLTNSIHVDGQALSGSLHHNEDHHTILLTHAIYVVRMAVQTYSGSNLEVTDRNKILIASRKTLGAVCKLDIQQTLPEVQHEFCDLWNKLVNVARTNQCRDTRLFCMKMLKNIRKLYIALHGAPRTAFNATDDWEQVMDNPYFYPECTEKSHRPSLWFADLQVDASQTQAGAPTPSDMTFPEPHSPTHPIHSSPPSSPDQPSESSPFPVANPYVPPPGPSSNLPHDPNVSRGPNVQ
jgi:hypothetical protein